MSHALTSTMDFVPTIVALAGGTLPTDRTFDGTDMAPVLFRNASELHEHLFFSVGGEVWNTNLPGQQQHKNPTGALFEAVRTTRWSAMFKVGYGAQCCEGPSGDANTPFNTSCTSPSGSLGYKLKWLETPLLFDLSADVGQESPLDPGSSVHAEALAAINAALESMNASLHDGKLQSVPSYAHDLNQKACCNTSNVVCRCTELPSTQA